MSALIEPMKATNLFILICSLTINLLEAKSESRKPEVTTPTAQASSQAIESAWQRMCEMMASLAETAMKKRQQGASMAEMMKIAENQGETIRSLAKSLTIAAYEQQRWQSEEHITRAIQDFRDSTYLKC